MAVLPRSTEGSPSHAKFKNRVSMAILAYRPITVAQQCPWLPPWDSDCVNASTYPFINHLYSMRLLWIRIKSLSLSRGTPNFPVGVTRCHLEPSRAHSAAADRSSRPQCHWLIMTSCHVCFFSNVIN